MTEVMDIPQSRSPRMAAVDSQASGSVAPAQSVAMLPELLDGGEVVIFAIRPSLWFLVFDSARWIALGGILILFAALSSTAVAGMSPTTIGKLGLVAIAARVGAALLRWVSRFYVLTNRRVMRLRGVMRADIESCPLLDVRNTRVTQDIPERATRLGTIEFVVQRQHITDLNWRYIAHPNDIHNQVRKAIERAIDNQPHG